MPGVPQNKGPPKKVAPQEKDSLNVCKTASMLGNTHVGVLGLNFQSQVIKE